MEKNQKKTPKEKPVKAAKVESRTAERRSTARVAGQEKLRLSERYKEVVRPELQKELGLANVMQTPCLKKIVVNIGSKESVADSKVLQVVCDVLEAITGQVPVRTIARKSIAGFKLREGMKIGACVTLRGELMYAFFDKLVSVVLPKVRDFQGVSPRLDGRGSYNLGIREWTVFPEAEAVAGDRMSGLNVTIQTSASNDDHARALLTSLGMPFRK